MLLVGCAVDTSSTESSTRYDFLSFKPAPQFDWMPPPLMWERNVRNCRSQPQCNAADLFNN